MPTRTASSAVCRIHSEADLGEEVYYDGVVHDAQLLYLLSRHFPAQATAAPPAALEAIGAAVSGNRVTSLSAAYTLLALDAFAKTAAANGALTVSEIARDGNERVLPLPAGVMPKVPVAPTAARVQFAKTGPASAYYGVNESGFDRNPPAAITRASRSSANTSMRMAHSPRESGREFFVRLRVDDGGTACPDCRR